MDIQNQIMIRESVIEYHADEECFYIANLIGYHDKYFLSLHNKFTIKIEDGMKFLSKKEAIIYKSCILNNINHFG